jgi:hypothetical protein
MFLDILSAEVAQRAASSVAYPGEKPWLPPISTLYSPVFTLPCGERAALSGFLQVWQCLRRMRWSKLLSHAPPFQWLESRWEACVSRTALSSSSANQLTIRSP